MPSMSCSCTDVMLASCELPDNTYVPIAMCALMAWWLWQRYEEEDDEDDAPSAMYS